MMEYLYIYVGGAFAWALIMSLMGESVDWMYLLSMLLWPVQAISMFGQIVRKAFGASPRK